MGKQLTYVFTFKHNFPEKWNYNDCKRGKMLAIYANDSHTMMNTASVQTYNKNVTLYQRLTKTAKNTLINYVLKICFIGSFDLACHPSVDRCNKCQQKLKGKHHPYDILYILYVPSHHKLVTG